MGTNNKPTDTVTDDDTKGFNFAFEHDCFVVTVTYPDDQKKYYHQLSDDEFQELDMVVFRERMNRFVGLEVNRS